MQTHDAVLNGERRIIVRSTAQFAEQQLCLDAAAA